MGGGYAKAYQHDMFIKADPAILLTKAQPVRTRPLLSSQDGTSLRETTCPLVGSWLQWKSIHSSRRRYFIRCGFSLFS